jgi:hypothetical protein
VKTMIKTVLIVILAVLVALGISELLHRAYIRYICPKRFDKYILVPLYSAEAPQQFDWALEQVRWNGRSYADTVIGVDFGLNAEVLEHVKAIADENQYAVICTADEIADVIMQRM